MKELYNLSKNLKNFRNQYGYTQKQVAEQIGITYQSYQAYERGIAVPSLQNFIKLAKLYDITYDELLEWPFGTSGLFYIMNFSPALDKG